MRARVRGRTARRTGLALLGVGVLVATVGWLGGTDRVGATATQPATQTAGRTATAGTVWYDGQQDVLSATQVRTGSVGGTLHDVHVFLGAVDRAPANHLAVALYGDSGGSGPGRPIVTSAAVVASPGGWNTVAMPATSLAADTSYWLVFNVDGRATQVAIAHDPAGRSAWLYPVRFGTWPAAGQPARTDTAQYALYLTYTAADPPTSPPPTSPPPTSAPPSSAPGSPGCGRPVEPGVSTRTITVGGVQRSYLLVLPAGLDPDTPTPVIMGFHGGSGTSAEARAGYGLEGSEPVIYVYPQAPYWPQAGGVAWDVDPAGVDFPYFDAMLAQLKNEHCVDAHRVFAAGKSNGGFFVNSLACNRPDDVRALASVAGGGPPNQCARPVAAMIIHGSADTTVPISTGRESRDYWLARDGYADAPPVPVDPPPCVSYPGTVAPVIWCQHDGAHVWPTWAGAGIRSFFLHL